ncbi:hypothetical protein Ae201684P_011576 [Aphanomyces euteiches]|nr:hypothetical protein Ae201684P_011576 [Aphanomyces euteiches]
MRFSSTWRIRAAAVCNQGPNFVFFVVDVPWEGTHHPVVKSDVLDSPRRRDLLHRPQISRRSPADLQTFYAIFSSISIEPPTSMRDGPFTLFKP